MRFLRTNTAVIVTVGPFYDKTDGVTIKTALTITNERITLTADTDDGSAPTNILDNVTGATSGTANDLNYITGNDAGMMQMELSAANVNRLGRMFLSITDAANHVPVFHEFMVLPAMIYDAFILGTDTLDASMTQILGTAVSTPATAGILDVNLKNIANATVSTSTAQLGVNAVQAGATAWGSGAITAGAIAADAITAAKIADGAIDAATFATGAITAGAIAADAIGASELAADAVTEIQNGLATAAALDAVDNFIDTEIAAIIATLTGIVPVSGTIGATGNDTTHLHLDGLAYADNGINSMLLTIKDVSTGLFYSRWIEAFANTGDLATVATLPFTPEASVDLYWITPVRADVTGGSGLDAAGVRAAVGLASANLDTQLTAIDDFLDTEIAAIKAKTDSLTFTAANQVDATTVTNSDKTGYTLTADFRIKKNTALANFMFVMVDSIDHVTPKTGLTITATRSLDGAAFGACANSASELSNGVYKISLAAGDLNADVVTLRFTASGGDDRLLTVITQTE